MLVSFNCPQLLLESNLDLPLVHSGICVCHDCDKHVHDDDLGEESAEQVEEVDKVCVWIFIAPVLQVYLKASNQDLELTVDGIQSVKSKSLLVDVFLFSSKLPVHLSPLV